MPPPYDRRYITSMDDRYIHSTNMDALGQYIARDFARHLRPRYRQMPMFIEDDFVNVTPDIAWNSDVYIDDDYIFGAHVVVVHRKHSGEAINSHGESLFIHRYPRRSTDGPEYITHWFGNEHPYGKGEPVSIARLTFVQWYHHVCDHHEAICERIKKGDPNPYGMMAPAWSPAEAMFSNAPLTFRYHDVLTIQGLPSQRFPRQ